MELVGRSTFLETFAGILDGEDVLRHCQDAHSEAAYAQLLQDGAVAYIASVDLAPIAYALLGPSSLAISSDSDDIELKRIYVLSRFQGSGVGQKLFHESQKLAVDAGASRLVLGVYSENIKAQAFYRRNGFQDCGRREFKVGARPYSDVMMAKALSM